MATEKKTDKQATFAPVTLVRDGEEAIADTAKREAELRWDGWRSKPSAKAEKPKPTPPNA